ncbi:MULTISPECIES: hypothetical protein [Bacillaceae]|uniref:Uncharacterized protein n=1 Tax=Evansella alkalicola TaxID=745819 RepID=A0ABS6JWP6_9BACI|nr:MULTISPECIES: hypothetical protein [Bacillaceae]MBU9722815.1 hypothetical protein [Bacillus alkalicola]
MKKMLLGSLISIALIVLMVFLFPIGKLIFTEANVVEANFIDIYYVSLQNEESEFEVFKQYMEDKGWTEVGAEGSGQWFEKNNETFYITSTELKTIFVNGWPNF